MGDFIEGGTAYLRALTYKNSAHREACQALENNALTELVRKTTVLKVGRKYISVGSPSGRIDGQYDKDTGKEKTEYSPNYRLYASWEEAINDIRAEHLWFVFRSRINSIAWLNINKRHSAIEMPKLEMAAKLFDIDIPWEPSPLYYNAHLVQASHEHHHGYDVTSGIAASQALAKKTVAWVKEKQFDYNPDCEDEVFNYSIEKVSIDLNQMEPCSESECAKAKENAAALSAISSDDREKTYIIRDALHGGEHLVQQEEKGNDQWGGVCGRYKTSDIIAALQRTMEIHGDLPFEICDFDNGIHYSAVSIYANTAANGGCEDGDSEAIGLQF